MKEHGKWYECTFKKMINKSTLKRNNFMYEEDINNESTFIAF